MGQLSEIARGWANWVIQPAEVRAQALVRLNKCEVCPHRKDFVGIHYCSLCGCPLAVRTMSPKSSCPDDPSKWGPMDKESYY